MKPPRQFILWYFHGVDQRILHEGVYPGSFALRLAVLTYVGTLDHEAFEIGELSTRPPEGLIDQMHPDEFLAAVPDALSPESVVVHSLARPLLSPDEFPLTVEAFIGDGLFAPVPMEDLRARGLDESLFGRLLRLNRVHLAKLSQEFGSVRRRSEELLHGASLTPEVAPFVPPAAPEVDTFG